MNTVFLCLGGNLGNREENLKNAIQLIKSKLGTITARSSVYETASWGNADQPAFLNQVLELKTVLSANDVLDACLKIEKDLGRTRNIKWENRLIDIDILFFNTEIINQDELKIPHPLMHERMFVLKPLNEIAPHYVHPVYNKTVKELFESCSDQLKVMRQ
ncbi:MAG: 2-amino-4-hydroxy-6-hydroxymethyldihydropteridine diphosphokinase [Bacteroidota bacterium]|nr:2-amino-4-hydroxy-6-hydroxymethyldihydropteridine diphosphokinase [Bacteroidota bacterium]